MILILLPILLASLLSITDASLAVTTLAGTPRHRGYLNAKGKQAQFNLPRRIAVHTDGTVYVSDTSNHCIRRITPDGKVSTFAGNTTNGFANGPGSTAMFSFPIGLSLDKKGNLYVVDSMNDRIRKVTPSGFVSTVYINHERTKEPGVPSRMNAPHGITLNHRGNIFVADTMNSIVRKITPDGIMSTYAGIMKEGLDNGPSYEASFNYPSDLVMDSKGNLFVVDYLNNCIRKITKYGFVSTFAGNGANGLIDGPPDLARFDQPRALTIDPYDNLYVSDSRNNVVRRITPDGFVMTIAGSSLGGYRDGHDSDARFSGPEGVAYHNGYLYVVDVFNHVVRKIYLNGEDSPKRPIMPRPIHYGKDECAICWNTKQSDQAFFYCSEVCGQSFHVDCIRQWIWKNGVKTCPMCRANWIRGRRVVKIPSEKTFDRKTKQLIRSSTI